MTGTICNTPVVVNRCGAAMADSKGRTTTRRTSRAGQRRRGAARVEEILVAARHVLATEGYAEFTLRRIARDVNIRLSTLQHYYPSKDDLFRAVVEKTVADYDAEYDRRATDWGSSARGRLLGMVRYLLDDLRNPDTAGFFVEFWARGLRDAAAAELLQRAYRHHRDRVRVAMAPLNPSLSGRTAEHRAVMVAALIEGMMLFIGAGRSRDAGLDGIEDEIARWVVKLARER
jgi:AcrR family transcriptional regulator